jgi:hypothetical protein
MICCIVVLEWTMSHSINCSHLGATAQFHHILLKLQLMFWHNTMMQPQDYWLTGYAIKLGKKARAVGRVMQVLNSACRYR